MTNLVSPLVSVVFTSYNHIEYLRQALDSLVNQTYNNIELIIVDDCSTDNSQSILKEYDHLPHVTLKLNAKNSGSYVKASNYGASFATGDFLLFAQCDDFAEPTQIERLVSAFSNNESIGVSFCRSSLVNEKGEITGDDFTIREQSFRRLCATDTMISKKEMVSFLSKSCVIPNLSAAMIKRELYSKSGGLSTEYIVAADWAFWLSIATISDFYYITKPLNNFRQHKTTIRSTIKIKKQILEIYQIFYNYINKHELPVNIKREFKVGAGAIWLSYFSQGKLTWFKSFPSVFTETFKLEPLNSYYLILGFFNKVKEVLKRNQ